MANAHSPNDPSVVLTRAFLDAEGLSDQRRTQVLSQLSLAASVIERCTGRAPRWGTLKADGLRRELSSAIQDPWLASDVTNAAARFSRFCAKRAA